MIEVASVEKWKLVLEWKNEGKKMMVNFGSSDRALFWTPFIISFRETIPSMQG